MTKYTRAQTSALTGAEDSDHGLRLPAGTLVGTCVALMDKGAVTHWAPAEDSENDEDGYPVPDYGHWLTEKGIADRAILLGQDPEPAPAAPQAAPSTEPRWSCTALTSSYNYPCNSDARWRLFWRAAEGKEMQRDTVCTQHLGKALKTHTPLALNDTVAVTPL